MSKLLNIREEGKSRHYCLKNFSVFKTHGTIKKLKAGNPAHVKACTVPGFDLSTTGEDRGEDGCEKRERRGGRKDGEKGELQCNFVIGMQS